MNIIIVQRGIRLAHWHLRVCGNVADIDVALRGHQESEYVDRLHTFTFTLLAHICTSYWSSYQISFGPTSAAFRSTYHLLRRHQCCSSLSNNNWALASPGWHGSAIRWIANCLILITHPTGNNTYQPPGVVMCCFVRRWCTSSTASPLALGFAKTHDFPNFIDQTDFPNLRISLLTLLSLAILRDSFKF